MAETLASSAATLEGALHDLATLTVADLVRFWREMGLPDVPGRVTDTVVKGVAEVWPHIVEPYNSAGADLTAQWYDELAPDEPYQAEPQALTIPEEQALSTAGWALRATGIGSPLTRLAGASKRLVYASQRDTVLWNAAREGVRWRRLAQPGACAFCRMLTTRGAVYGSQQAAAGRRYHDHCRCVAVPERGGQTFVPPAYAAKWEQDYIDAVRAASAAGDTKGEYGAIDLKAVLRRMEAEEPRPRKPARPKQRDDAAPSEKPPVNLDEPAIPATRTGGSEPPDPPDVPPTLPPVPGADGGDDKPRYTGGPPDLEAPGEGATAAEVKSYWMQRQQALPVEFHGDVLEPSEVRFVERFLDLGEQLEWIPKSQGQTSTNDFLWTSNQGLPIEQKTTKARYRTIEGRIIDAVKRALINHGVTKDNFIVDIEDVELTDELRAELANYNVGREKYRISKLWVMARGQLHSIDLRK
ncbi:hypothetical protein [Mycolicibacterium fortuitum]|uniref:VG15 protein n=1 Tax=Mycolicibacterium fortuitum TaxID=1766 RepID=UPI0026247A1E|nr:hypothetical protein [Mycolicibacterium fortuitum]